MELENFNIEYLLVFTGLLFLLLFFVYIFYIKQKVIQSNIPLIENIKNYKVKFFKFKKVNIDLIKIGFIGISILMLLFILLGPRGGVDTQKTKAEGIDVMFALDISNSMKALDFQDSGRLFSRLDAAKEMIRNYVVKNNQNRYGLISFAGESLVSIPLTTDTNLFVTFLSGINEGSVSKGGTDLTKAVGALLDRFIDSENRAKIVIVVSDGGDEKDDINYSTVKRLISDNGIQIFTIGVGSVDGNFIPEGQDFFGRISYKTFNGEKVLTKLYEYPLKKIASQSGGKYFRADSFSALGQINKEIESLQKTTIDKKLEGGKKDLYRYFVSISFVLFLIGIFV